MNNQQKHQMLKLSEECANATDKPAALGSAQALYRLGRKHQRESDAELCKAHRVYTRISNGEKYLAPYIFDWERHEGVLFSEAILKNDKEV